MYAPVVTRFLSYDVALDSVCAAYCKRVMSLPDMSVTGAADGPPTYLWPSIGDSGTGMHCVIGILAALMQRHATGQGQQVEVSMQDAVLNLIRVSLRDHQRFGRTMPRNGNQLGSGVPGNTYRCAPGGPNDYAFIFVQPQMWHPLLKAMSGRGRMMSRCTPASA